MAVRASNDPLKVLSPWVPGFFRPLGQLSFYLQYLIFRFHAVPYNLVDLGLHGVAGVGVWHIAGRTGLSRSGRSFAMLLFLVGAGHFCKPVVWACSRPIILGTGLSLAATSRLLPSSVGGGAEP